MGITIDLGMNNPHTEISQIILNGGNLLDLHCWIEHNGERIDYDPADIICLYKTDDVVYKPFPMPLQKEAHEAAVKLYKRKKDLLNKGAVKGMTWQTYLERAKVTPGYCFIKAIHYYKKHHTDDAKLVYGSLGFRQSNGDVFYEHG